MLIEAVIGLGPQLFYGTGIPACILVLRPAGSKPAERKGKVLFINADRDYREGRAQNYLEPEHVEKIVSAFRKFEDVPDFARVVSRDRASRERRQPQHPPLRRHHAATGAAGRPGAPAWRYPQDGDRREGGAFRRARLGPRRPVRAEGRVYVDFADAWTAAARSRHSSRPTLACSAAESAVTGCD